MKRLLALLMALVLLTGCGSLSWMPGKPQAVSAPEIPQWQRPQRVLTVCLEAGAVMPATLEEYAQAREITLEQTADLSQAAVVVTAAQPQGEQWLDLSQDPALAQMMELEPRTWALPGENCPYGYLPNTKALAELFGGSAPLSDLAAATFEEWESFLEAAAQWLEEPGRVTVTLNGVDYMLTEEKGPGCQKLTGLFAIDCTQGFGAAALEKALLASGGETTAQRLTGPLNSSWQTFGMEQEYLAVPGTDGAAAKAAFLEGKALFLRGTGWDALPMKFSFDETDLAPGCHVTLEELARQTTQVSGGWLAIPAQAGVKNQEEGLGYLLWLAAEEKISQPKMMMTASQSKAVNQALADCLGKKWTPQLRKTYIKKVLDALN